MQFIRDRSTLTDLSSSRRTSARPAVFRTYPNTATLPADDIAGLARQSKENEENILVAFQVIFDRWLFLQMLRAVGEHAGVY